jgi:hypothetical protein
LKNTYNGQVTSMPFKSKAQMRWGNSSSGVKALGKKGVKEWDQATKGKSLPQKVKKKKPKYSWDDTDGQRHAESYG